MLAQHRVLCQVYASGCSIRCPIKFSLSLTSKRTTPVKKGSQGIVQTTHSWSHDKLKLIGQLSPTNFSLSLTSKRTTPVKLSSQGIVQTTHSWSHDKLKLIGHLRFVISSVAIATPRFVP